jgi:hypothetical protein
MTLKKQIFSDKEIGGWKEKYWMLPRISLSVLSTLMES